LIAVVVVSAAGTLILQRPMTDPDEMQRAYSPLMLRILDSAGLTNVFHAWWFVLMLGLVSISIIAASIERFPNAWRYFARPYKVTDEAFRRGVALHKQIPVVNEEGGLAATERALRSTGFHPERIVRNGVEQIFAERNRFSQMAVYIVHASLLLIFLGGIIDGVYGWRGFVSLQKGQSVSTVTLRDGGTRELPFAVRCDGAGQENYKDGSPKRWWSKLAVTKDGKELQRKEIVVNDPLIFAGVRFYQSSYGSTGQMDKLLLTASPRAGGGKPKDIELSVGQTVELDENTSVRLARFVPDYFVREGQVFTRSESPENPAVQMFVESRNTGKSVEVWLPEIREVAHNQEFPYAFEPRDLQMAYFTGLQVSHEPGQWAVWTGCLLMGLGLAAAFYLVHMRIWAVPVLDGRGQLTLWIGGAANKNRDAFEQRFAAIVQNVEEELKNQPQKVQPKQPVACAEEHVAAGV
jgi:cytochrome c biogenesis protein